MGQIFKIKSRQCCIRNFTALSGIAKNWREFKPAKNTITQGAPPLLPPQSIFQNQGKTMVLLVLSLTAPLALLTLMSITKHSYVYVGRYVHYNECTSIGI